MTYVCQRIPLLLPTTISPPPSASLARCQYAGTPIAPSSCRVPWWKDFSGRYEMRYVLFPARCIQLTTFMIIGIPFPGDLTNNVLTRWQGVLHTSQGVFLPRLYEDLTLMIHAAVWSKLVVMHYTVCCSLLTLSSR
ncbi:hypothetical protein C8F04DRAFT_722102 [Mycena alexandri]|uniref:Uncharacterized protein n=1 Tax=Mycena alexandri TaxID=1745969 RepID=A0AAD6XB95_9AGAR|nr:hypothetical protein C8F04DRAFT_722102 [Mycena alexandri]